MGRRRVLAYTSTSAGCDGTVLRRELASFVIEVWRCFHNDAGKRNGGEHQGASPSFSARIDTKEANPVGACLFVSVCKARAVA